MTNLFPVSDSQVFSDISALYFNHQSIEIVMDSRKTSSKKSCLQVNEFFCQTANFALLYEQCCDHKSRLNL